MKPSDFAAAKALTSFAFYAALDAIEQTFDEVEKVKKGYDKDLKNYRRWMEEAADEMFEIAATTGSWSAAYKKSGWFDFQCSWERFMKEVWDC